MAIGEHPLCAGIGDMEPPTVLRFPDGDGVDKEELVVHTWPEYGDPRFFGALEELAALHSKKGMDYGTGLDIFANIRASEDFGIPAWLGAALRANDKVKRIQAFAVNGSLANEGLEDSLMDLAAYAIIGLVLFRAQKQAESVELVPSGA